MQFKSHHSIILAGVATSIACLSLFFSYMTQNNLPVQATYAVFDPQQALTDLSLPKLKVSKNEAEASEIVKSSRIKLESWIQKDMNRYCPAPCIVFNKTDVVIGDVVDLNAKFASDLNKVK